MSSEHVEVLRHMKETIKAIMPSEVAALDAAIASLSAPQPPAEAQAVELLDEAYGELAADSYRDGPRSLLLTRMEAALAAQHGGSDND